MNGKRAGIFSQLTVNGEFISAQTRGYCGKTIQDGLARFNSQMEKNLI